MRHWIASLLVLLLPFGSYAAVELRISPATAYIESGMSSQELNFDFILNNTTSTDLTWVGVELKVLDKQGNAIRREFFDTNSRAHAELPRKGRTIPAGKSQLIFNPFHTFSANVPLNELEYRFTFVDANDKEYVEQTRVKPVQYAVKTSLILPLKGRVLLWDGHDYAAHHRRMDYNVPMFGIENQFHTNFQRYGYDLVIVDDKGEMTREPLPSTQAWYRHDPKDNAQFYGFAAEVHAPGAGKIVEMHDGEADNLLFDVSELRTRETAYGGNFIIIDHENGEFSWLGHLKQGSVRVAVGQRVKQGEVVAQVGASGSSLFPHLHYELRTAAGAANADGLPSTFHGITRPGQRGSLGSDGHIAVGEIVESK
jgi:murein DD-endopeptidase MepM/ murein hydrolase activator NlpD